MISLLGMQALLEWIDNSFQVGTQPHAQHITWSEAVGPATHTQSPAVRAAGTSVQMRPSKGCTLTGRACAPRRRPTCTNAASSDS